LVRNENTFSLEGAKLDAFAQAIFDNCLPREGRSQLPRGFLFWKPEPIDQDLPFSVIIPTVVEKSFENEFRALMNLIAHLTEGLGPRGPCLLAIPRRWCGGTNDFVTAHSTETLRALHEKPMFICS